MFIDYCFSNNILQNAPLKVDSINVQNTIYPFILLEIHSLDKYIKDSLKSL